MSDVAVGAVSYYVCYYCGAHTSLPPFDLDGTNETGLVWPSICNKEACLDAQQEVSAAAYYADNAREASCSDPIRRVATETWRQISQSCGAALRQAHFIIPPRGSAN